MPRRRIPSSTLVVFVIAGLLFGAQMLRFRSSPQASLLVALSVRTAALGLCAVAAALSLAAAALHALVCWLAPERLRRHVVGLVPAALGVEAAWVLQPALRNHRWSLWCLVSLLLVGSVLVGALLHRLQLPSRACVGALAVLCAASGVMIWMPGRRMPRRTPNVVLLGLDGLEADHLSAYGYARKTSPFLDELRGRAFFMEQAYSNACCTLGATTALLTGKLPTRTHVIFPPQELTGKDRYQHLPGLLRSVGYQTYQFAWPDYGDAYAAGLRDAFVWDNGRRITSPAKWIPRRLVLPYLILKELWWRSIRGREEPGPEAPAKEVPDQDKLEETLQALENDTRPIFAHVHLMDTHGARFPDVPQVFSKGAQKSDWMTDFYDDTIYASDQRLRWFFDRLRKSSAGEHTIVVIYSDHGMMWNPLRRVPLILYAPGYPWLKGSREENVQLVDVAPTILDLVGLERPFWMSDGSSLLSAVNPSRVIVAAATVESAWLRDHLWVLKDPKSPFHGMVSLSALACRSWVRFDLGAHRATSGLLPGQPGQCRTSLTEILSSVDHHLVGTGHPAAGATPSTTEMEFDY
jgi:hypothetical protein